MKLPKALLSAILIGIAVQTVSSCTKDPVDSKAKQEAKQNEKPKKDPCPACGMG